MRDQESNPGKWLTIQKAQLRSEESQQPRPFGLSSFFRCSTTTILSFLGVESCAGRGCVGFSISVIMES